MATPFSILAQSHLSWGASPVTQMSKNLPAMQKTQVPSLEWENPLEKRMATQSSIFAWRIPWTEEPGRLGSQRVRQDWSTNTFTFTERCIIIKLTSRIRLRGRGIIGDMRFKNMRSSFKKKKNIFTRMVNLHALKHPSLLLKLKRVLCIFYHSFSLQIYIHFPGQRTSSEIKHAHRIICLKSHPQSASHTMTPSHNMAHVTIPKTESLISRKRSIASNCLILNSFSPLLSQKGFN